MVDFLCVVWSPELEAHLLQQRGIDFSAASAVILDAHAAWCHGKAPLPGSAGWLAGWSRTAGRSVRCLCRREGPGVLRILDADWFDESASRNAGAGPALPITTGTPHTRPIRRSSRY